MYRKKSQHIPSDVESVALGTLLVGMRQLYAETTQYMKSRIERLEERYAALMGAGAALAEPPSETAVIQRKKPANSGWPGTPEERSKEMMRRMAVARGEAKGRRRNNYNVAKDQKLSQERKKQWAALSPKRRKERLAKMLAGRVAKQVPAVQMEKAS